MFLNTLRRRISISVPESEGLAGGTNKKRRKRASQRYFSGWALREELGPNGRARARRTYLGPRYSAGQSDSAFRRGKLVSLLLSVLSCCLMAAAIYLTCRAVETLYVFIAQILSVIALLFSLWYSIIKCLNPKIMTVGEYRESAIGHPICIAVALLFLALTALAMLLQCAIGEAAPELLYGAGVTAAAALVTFIQLRSELRTEYFRVS